MKRRLVRHDASRASRSAIFSVGGFGALMVALSIATENGRYLIERLPLPEPGLNGWPVFLLILFAGGGLWRMSRIQPPERQHLERLRALEQQEARDNEKWPDAGNELFGTFPFTEAPQPRKVHPLFTAEDLDPDPEQFGPTLLPRRARPERRVRS